MEMGILDNASVEEYPSIVESRIKGVKSTAVRRRKTRRSKNVLEMDPAMWSTLPKELLWLIFANLPLPQLLSLRRSALDGNWDTELDNPEFIGLCAQKHVNMCAVILPTAGSGTYSIGVHCAESTSWQKLRLTIGEPSSIMSSSDGGLVCFALTFESTVNDAPSLVILVVNPLTGDCRELPGHGVRPTHLKMMQLVMHQNTKRYQVLLVANKEVKFYGDEVSYVTGIEAMLFDSGTSVWTNTKNSSELFFGLEYRYFQNSWCGDHFQHGPWLFDCAAGRLNYLHEFDRNPCGSNFRSTPPCALVKDHLFAFDKILGDDNNFPVFQFSVSEHQIQVQKLRLSWIKLTEHHFGPTDHPSVKVHKFISNSYVYRYHCKPRLHACKGFLLVVGRSKHDFAWLYNLATGDCLDIQKQRDGHRIAVAPVMLCELQWDAVP